MTFTISKELQFLAGHGFYVKLTRMSNALYPYRVVYLPENSCNYGFGIGAVQKANLRNRLSNAKTFIGRTTKSSVSLKLLRFA
ncbi:hypothetical protein [Nostoc sp. CHAB 5715]|uniref:hypothetical protein n=1 Tax=Nostoc sp. CHAB 5715 TaxID=2780400 RepID=UPI001E61BBBC|nr:hypothetical protein [Nostoc sp. CHAB 5715]MCC5625133.1 hypothetical protein [Nostoc sp. CHAB 5715]